MVKKLDKLIIKAFVGPFIATFFITLLVLVMQFFWLYIDDFVGKGLGTGIILEFIGYKSTDLVPLALPLAVLLSSLMTFGNLGESYELVAIKSAGISLLRFMRPLFVISILISGIAFLFSNYIIPVANLKSRTLLADIVYAKPSFDIREGVFYDRINGFAIKIGKKGTNDSTIRDVIIYEQTSSLQDNFIIAKDGIMKVSNDKRFLEFNLKDGWRYQERGTMGAPNTEFIRIGFKEYKKQFDLSIFQFQRTADSVNRNNHRMLSMRQLDKAIDSLRKQNKEFQKKAHESFVPALAFLAYLDSAKKKKDTITIKSFDALVSDSLEEQLQQNVSIKVENLRSSNDFLVAQNKDQKKILRQHQIEWHRKISLSLACVVLFLIGAPLGSIIRKGGLGSPLVLSIVFFMIFYFLSNTGEKMSKEGSVEPTVGMWISTMVLVPVGVFLTSKALKDSQLFNKEYYFRSWQKIRSYWRRNQA